MRYHFYLCYGPYIGSFEADNWTDANHAMLAKHPEYAHRKYMSMSEPIAPEEPVEYLTQ